MKQEHESIEEGSGGNMQINELRKDFDRRMACGTSEGGFWNDVESLNKQRVWNFFLPHLNSRNLLERFVNYLFDVGTYMLEEPKEIMIENIDKFIESEGK